jgi:hypothetical protein
MQLQRFLVPVACVMFVFAAYRSYAGTGVAFAVGLLLMWLLLHFTRLMQVLRRAADQPVGYIGSAVMLNAKLKPGVSLLHVVAMTKALGELKSTKDTQPELFRWTDATRSHVSCEFHNGKLKNWVLVRPVEIEQTADHGDVSKAS